LTFILAACPAGAEDLSYSSVDRATVRVLALAAPGIITIEHQGQNYQIGIPVGGHGSGALLTADGLVLTAAHVVHNARILAVHLPGARQPVPAKVLYVNEQEDYAFIRASGTFKDVAQLAPADSALKVRETIFAIGYPLDANRVDPQSSRGAISGKLPDGHLQLDISVNPGNSGGPVIDDKELVQAIVVARSDVEHGAVGLASAVPASVFRHKYEELSAAGAGDLSDLASEKSVSVANMISMLAHDGPDWFKGSLETSEAQQDMNQRVKKMAEDMPESADAQLLASVYFWNRYMVRVANGAQTETLHQRALDYTQKAAKLAPDLKESSDFVQFVLGEGKAEREPRRYGARPRHHEGFFLGAGYGLGYSSWTVNSGSDKLEVSGLTREWQVLIGGGAKGFIWGALLASAGANLHYDQTLMSGSTADQSGGDTDLSILRYGAFMQVYPWITRGLHLQAQVCIYGADANGSSVYLNGSGFALTGGAGYDLWFADHWSAGVTANATYFSSDSGSGSEGAISPTVAATITWN
jgi:hypothetical protein